MESISLLLKRRVVVFILLLLFTTSISVIASTNRYDDVMYCYVTDGGYTSWSQMDGYALYGKNESGILCVYLYWSMSNTPCLVLKMTDMDLYQLSKKEKEKLQRQKGKKSFSGTGTITYYTFSGRYNFENFPGGDAYPRYGGPKGELITRKASFQLEVNDGYDIIEVNFDKYQFSIGINYF